MVKRKAAKKMEAKKNAVPRRAKAVSNDMPVPAMLLKVLAAILSVILVIALTLYVLGRMPARGFWTLIILLAIIGFFVMPAMKRRFVSE